MNDSTIHAITFLISSGALAGIILTLIWVGSIKTKVETMWEWWCNHAGRGTKVRMKDGDGE